MWRFSKISCVFVVIVFLLMAVPALAQYQVGDTVANFTLYDAYGNSVSLNSFMGLVVVINIWADW